MGRLVLDNRYGEETFSSEGVDPAARPAARCAWR